MPLNILQGHRTVHPTIEQLIIGSKMPTVPRLRNCGVRVKEGFLEDVTLELRPEGEAEIW